MKKAILLFFLAGYTNVFASVVVMPRVKVDIFVNKGKTDFTKIFNKDIDFTKKKVEWLFANNRLDHDFSKAVNLKADFTTYWAHFSANWHSVDLNKDGFPELVFSGKPMVQDEKEMLSIYVQYEDVWKEVFWDDGHLMAYKMHPATGEIILFHHRYPCCSQSTHMVQRLRWLNNKLYTKQRYFLARDKDMKGQFFPTKAIYPKKYRTLKKKTMLYWSKGIIKKGAAKFSPTNTILHYPKGARYQVLAKSGSWYYVMMISAPVQEESLVANAMNLLKCRYYGWIQK